MPRYPYRQIGVGSPKQFRNDQNKNLVDIAADIAEQKARVDEQITSVEQPSEVVDARVDADGTTHTVLKDRLDSDQQKVTEHLTEKANQACRFYATTFDNEQMKLVIMKSDDGINFKSLNLDGSFTPYPDITESKTSLRDPSIVKNFDEYIIVFTRTDWGTGNYFGIVTTTDFVNYSQKADIYIPTIPSTAQVWAPSLFKDDDGQIYVVVNAGVDKTAGKQVYIAKLNSDYTCGTFTQITGLQGNMIDAHVYKINKKYYMIFKNETTKLIEIAVSSSLLTGWSLLKTGDWAGWGSAVEGPYVIKLDDRWRLYVDNYDKSIDGDHNIFYSDSFNDMDTWTPLLPIQADFECRHLMVIDRNESTSLSNPILAKRVRLSSLATSGVIDNFYPEKDVLYYLYGNDGKIEINHFFADNLNAGDSFYMIASSEAITDYIEINNANAVDSVQQLMTSVYRIGMVAKNYDTVIKFTCTTLNGKTRIYPSKSPDVCQNASDLGTGSGPIQVYKNSYYIVSQHNSRTITGFDTSTMNIGDKFYLCLASAATDAQLVISTTAAFLPGDKDLVINKANGNNEAVIEFILMSDGVRAIL